MSRAENRQKKQHAWGNYYFVYQGVWQFDKKVLLFAALQVIVGVITAFGMILLPAVTIGLLEHTVTAAVFMRSILLLFLGYGIICSSNHYLKQRNGYQYIGFRVHDKTAQYMEQSMKLDYCQYEKEEIQQMKNIANEALGGNVQGVEGILHQTVEVLTAGIGLVLYAACISTVNPWIILMLVGISLVQMGSFRVANQYELKHREQKANLKIHQEYLDRKAYEVGAGKDIRLYQMQEWLSSHYLRANKAYQKLIARERSGYFANSLLGLVLQLGRDAVCYWYLICSLQEGMPVSQFVLSMGMVAGFSAYFSDITNRCTQLQRSQRQVGFLRQYLDLQPEFHHGTGKKLSSQEQTIEVVFSHVTFTYPGSEQKILDDISFTMKKGEKIALVGINGAGKTTIVKLLCGFYHPTQGQILLNGTDLSELDLESYYQDLAVVFQEAFTWSFTIAENVSCENAEHYNREHCISVLKQAGLWDKVEKLPKQEQTFLNKDMAEDGLQLSGGELQKLMLAHALYQNCRSLLLDEPTAALDAIAENEMYERYREMIKGKTTMFISHRLASTRFCDQILFLEKGKIAEQGTHEELMQKQGTYAQMFEVQSKYYREEGTADENEEDENK